MRIRTIALAGALAVIGCSGDLENFSWTPQPPTSAEIAAADRATCASYGFPRGHAEHGGCILALAQLRLQE